MALRRKPGDLNPAELAFVRELTGLIELGQVVMIGPVRQELLSGVREKTKFERLRAHLRFFRDEAMILSDYEAAAEFHNTCQKKGVSGSAIDFLICAVAVRLNTPIFTLDKDFERYGKHLPIRLHTLSLE
jgi:predicted nucleic acid-binding protein